MDCSCKDQLLNGTSDLLLIIKNMAKWLLWPSPASTRWHGAVCARSLCPTRQATDLGRRVPQPTAVQAPDGQQAEHNFHHRCGEVAHHRHGTEVLDARRRRARSAKAPRLTRAKKENCERDLEKVSSISNKMKRCSVCTKGDMAKSMNCCCWMLFSCRAAN